MAKKKKIKKRRGRKEVEDKIVQTRFGLRRSDWEEITKTKFHSPEGNKIFYKIIRESLIKNGYNLKK